LACNSVFFIYILDKVYVGLSVTKHNTWYHCFEYFYQLA